MNNSRALRWQRLTDLLHEADALQQELVADPGLSYDYHCQLTDMAEDLEQQAAQEQE